MAATPRKQEMTEEELRMLKVAPSKIYRNSAYIFSRRSSLITQEYGEDEKGMREAMEVEMGGAAETLPMAGMSSMASTLEALGIRSYECVRFPTQALHTWVATCLTCSFVGRTWR